MSFLSNVVAQLGLNRQRVAAGRNAIASKLEARELAKKIAFVLASAQPGIKHRFDVGRRVTSGMIWTRNVPSCRLIERQSSQRLFFGTWYSR